MKKGLLLLAIGLVAIAYSLSLYSLPTGYWGFAPAVVGKNSGALSNLSAAVVMGYGRVFVGGPLLGSDFQGSMGGAAVAASIVSGVPFTSLDFMYYLGDIGNNVTLRAAGPSGSALASTLTLLNILGLKCDKHPAMTGMIGLGGEVLPVGGVKIKGEAVRAYGISTFLVPLGEAVPINGLQIHTVPSIIDAAKYFTDQNVTKALGRPCSPPPYLKKVDVFKYHYEKLYHLAEKLFNETKANLPEKLLKRIKRELFFAKVAASEGNYYSAASYAFTALIQLYSQYFKRLVQQNGTKAITNLVKELEPYTSLKPQGCGANYWSAEACAAVYNREFRLSEMLKNLKNFLQMNETAVMKHIETVSRLMGQAKARAISIGLWSEAVKQLADIPFAPKLRNLDKVAKEAYAIALASAKYALSLIPIHGSVGGQISDAVDEMSNAMFNGNYFKVIGLSSYTFETSADALGSIQNSTTVATEIMPLVVGRSYCELPSFIAYNYSSYVDSLLKTDKLAAEFLAYTALFYAHLAEVASK